MLIIIKKIKLENRLKDSMLALKWNIELYQ